MAIHNPDTNIACGVVGCGIRTTHLCRHLRKHAPAVTLRAIYDPDASQADAFAAEFGHANLIRCDSYEQMLADTSIPWVILASPNHLHVGQLTAAIAAGKHVFLEKPMATTVEGLQTIRRACHDNDRMLITGFVLRCAPIYRRVRELLDEGVIGRILSVEANENITAAHGGHIMTCWRRFSQQSGSHILEKCCHDIDLLNWYVGDLPARVASFGGRNFFVPENESYLRAFNSPPHSDSLFLAFPRAGHDADNPFTSEKDIIDNQVAIIEYGNGVRATFHTNLSNAIPERRIHLCGSEGTMTTELYNGTLRYCRLGYEQEIHEQNFSSEQHGGGDEQIVQQLVNAMTRGTLPQWTLEEGLESCLSSLMIEQARTTNTVIDLQPIWQQWSCEEQRSAGSDAPNVNTQTH